MKKPTSIKELKSKLKTDMEILLFTDLDKQLNLLEYELRHYRNCISEKVQGSKDLLDNKITLKEFDAIPNSLLPINHLSIQKIGQNISTIHSIYQTK